MGGGRLQEVVAHGGSTVHVFQWYTCIVCNTSLLLYFISKTNHDIGLLLLCLLFVPVCQYSVNSSLKADHLIPAALWIGDPVREQTVQDRFPIIKTTVMINITGQTLRNLTIKIHLDANPWKSKIWISCSVSFSVAPNIKPSPPPHHLTKNKFVSDVMSANVVTESILWSKKFKLFGKMSCSPKYTHGGVHCTVIQETRRCHGSGIRILQELALLIISTHTCIFH